MSACDCGSNAAWKSHTFIVLQEGGGTRMRSTVEVGVSVVVTVTASLVPKAKVHMF